jgi:hypothetical protein
MSLPTINLKELKAKGFIKALDRKLDITKCTLAADAAKVLNADAGVPGTLFVVISDDYVSKNQNPIERGVGFFIPDGE